MKYTSFEQLPVWKDGIKFSDRCFRMAADKSFYYQGDLSRQLGSAGLSVPNNIAEGFEKDTTKDLIKFLYIARGSAGEVRSMMYVLALNERYSHLEAERVEILKMSDSISRQLRAWILSIRPKVARANSI